MSIRWTYSTTLTSGNDTDTWSRSTAISQIYFLKKGMRLILKCEMANFKYDMELN